MPTQDLAPDAVLETSNLTAAVGTIDDDPDSPAGDWTTAGSNGNTILRVSFPTPTNTLTTGAGLQTFKCYVRRDASGGNATPWSLQLYESGTLVSTVATGSDIASTTGQLISGTWNASSLAAGSGANVELRLEQTNGGTGTPSGRRFIEHDAVEWVADYQSSQTVTGDFITSTVVMHGPTVSPGAITAVGDFITSSVVLYGMTVALSSQTVTGDFISSTAVLNGPHILNDCKRRLVPNNELLSTNLTADVAAHADIDEFVYSEAIDANWYTADTPGSAVEGQWEFSAPGFQVTTGAHRQRINIWVRRTGTGGVPTVRIDLRQAGSLIRSGTAENVNSTTGEIHSLDFNGAELATLDLFAVEAGVVGTGVGGESVEVGAVEICCDVYDYAQDLTGDFIASSATLYGPTVALGSQTVTGDFITSTAALYGPTVSPQPVTVTGDFISSAVTYYEGAVTHTVFGDHIVSTATLYGPTVDEGQVTVTGDFIVSAAVLYGPTVTPQPVTVTGDFITSTETLYGPTVSPQPVTVTGDFIASSLVLYEGEVTHTITGDFITSTATLYGPTVDEGQVTVTGDFITSTATLYGPTVANDTGAQNVTGDFISSGAALYGPTVDEGAVTVTGDFVTSTATLYEGEVTHSLTGDFVTSTVVLYGPEVTHTVFGDFITSTETLYGPTVANASGTQTVTGDFITSTATPHAPTVSPQPVTVTGDFIAGASSLYGPTVSGVVDVTGDFVASTAVLYEGEATHTIFGGFIASTEAMYGPVVAPQPVSVTGDFISSTATMYGPVVFLGGSLFEISSSLEAPQSLALTATAPQSITIQGTAPQGMTGEFEI